MNGLPLKVPERQLRANSDPSWLATKIIMISLYMGLVSKHFAKVMIKNVFELIFLFQRYLFELDIEQIESLEISYKHLAEQEPILAAFLAKAPAEMLKIFD